MNSPYVIQVLQRAFDIIDVVARRPRSVREIAQELSLDPSTVYRIVRNLEDRAYLRRLDDPNNSYGLGHRLAEFGTKQVRDFDLQQHCRGYLIELVAEVGESAFLCVRDEWDCVCIDRIDSPRAIRLSVELGHRRPLNAGAIGKLLLAYSPDSLIAAFLARPLGKFTDNTIRDAEQMRREIASIREKGYALSVGEHTNGAASIAVPIRRAGGEVTIGLSLAGPQSRLLRATESHIEVVKRYGEQISRSLGALSP